MRLAIFFVFCLIFTAANALTVRIGVTPFSPPFLITSDSKNHFSGFDMDLMNEICKRINATCNYKTFGSFKAVLQAGINNEIDLAIGGIIITSERESLYQFSLPYLKSTAQYMTRYGEHIKNISDIRGKTIGVADGTIFESLAKAEFSDTVTIKTYDTLSLMLVALANRDVDVVLLNGPNAQYWVANSDNIYETIGKPIPLGLGYGFVAHLNDQQLILKINQALLSMESDGTYLKIYNTYF